ncbi:MAG: 1-hydroxycarotenoid 3,4-desaturase CrtD [Chitinophagaceae bacterium]
MSTQKAIVIGAGVAGLATAIRLAVNGFQVKVYEQNSYPGGKLSYFERKGYMFDAGPSLFTQPQNIEELFAIANEPIEAYFKYEKVPVACKYFFESGKVVTAYADAQAFDEEVHQQLGEPKGAVQQYLQQANTAYNNIGNVFLNYSLHKRSTLRKANIRKAIAATKASYLLQSMHRYNSKAFKSKEAVQIFDRFATYNGSNPYKAPAMLTMIPHLEHNEGTFYPKGGMISITYALYNLAVKKGVHFAFNTSVQSIITNNRKAVGVVVEGENEMADVIVSNVDVYFTYKNLIGDAVMAQKILKQERSSSAFIFYWGINKQFPALQLHNIFFGKQYQQEFASIFEYKKLHNDPTVYVNITSKLEPGIQAPEGKENWFVMVNVPANVGQAWDALQMQCRKLVIDKINRILHTDIERFIEVEEVLTPPMIEAKTGSYMGSLYGTSSNSRVAAFVRHANFTKAINGLYFVGGSVHPGGGIPLCLKSAKIASEIIADDFKKQHQHL